MSKKPKVLFLSAGNSTRSQIAERFLRSNAGDRFEVVSAGIESNATVNPLAVEIMTQDGVDISQQYSKSVADPAETIDADSAETSRTARLADR